MEDVADVNDADVRGMDALFHKAADHVQAQVSVRNPAFNGKDLQLSIYALYKQALVGPCNVKKPGFLDPAGRAKWDAWNKLGTLSSMEAKSKYVERVQEADKDWRPNQSQDETLESDGVVKASTSKKSGMGPVFSAFAYDEDQDQQRAASSSLPEDAMHELAGQGDVMGVARLLGAGSWPLDLRDESGCTALHFAADRGQCEVVELLVSAGSDVNASDEDGLTPLHYAAMCGQEQACKLLLRLGADSFAEDAQGQRPRALGQVRWDFWPDKAIAD